jgi:glutamine amidotransferase
MRLPKVTVIDYGVGNLLSVKRGLEKCDAKVILTSDPKLILAAERVVLPGVGAFSSAMKALKNLGLVEVLGELAQRKTPLLGICLGMHCALEESEEFGLTAGLGLIPGRVIPVPNRMLSGETQKIPHIGWNALQPSNNEAWKHKLMKNNRPGEAAYSSLTYVSKLHYLMVGAHSNQYEVSFVFRLITFDSALELHDQESNLDQPSNQILHSLQEKAASQDKYQAKVFYAVQVHLELQPILSFSKLSWH